MEQLCAWEFRFVDRVFYVCAPTIEAAHRLVLQHLGSAAEIAPQPIPDEFVRFLQMQENTLIEARFFSFTGESPGRWTSKVRTASLQQQGDTWTTPRGSGAVGP